MNKGTNHSVSLAAAAASLIILLLSPSAVLPQNTKPTSAPGSTIQSGKTESASKEQEKAEAILQQATNALGGRAYLEVRTIVGRGLFTSFQDGKSGLPSQFLDYLVFPDRERTEFRAQGIRTIQTNVGTTGWVYDGGPRALRDMTPKQTEEFRFAMRTSVDNLLRGWWRKEGARLGYVGRREAGLARRNEVVRLTYPDDSTVEFEFGAKDFLPAKAIYKRPGSEDPEVIEEDRFAQYIVTNGVRLPLVIDHFRSGVQTSRINYELVEFNVSIPDSLFARPADVKALK